ncbi:MAG: hypothetical protein NTZ06_00475 [Actinobacteria bacterium]|nr:hypothetical protein [Actinomycetota bacterium]
MTCKQCGKATWSGCGEHIEEALHGIAQSEHCPGHAGDAVASSQPGFLGKLFGKK